MNLSTTHQSFEIPSTLVLSQEAGKSIVPIINKSTIYSNFPLSYILRFQVGFKKGDAGCLPANILFCV